MKQTTTLPALVLSLFALLNVPVLGEDLSSYDGFLPTGDDFFRDEHTHAILQEVNPASQDRIRKSASNDHGGAEFDYGDDNDDRQGRHQETADSHNSHVHNDGGHNSHIHNDGGHNHQHKTNHKDQGRHHKQTANQHSDGGSHKDGDSYSDGGSYSGGTSGTTRSKGQYSNLKGHNEGAAVRHNLGDDNDFHHGSYSHDHEDHEDHAGNDRHRSSLHGDNHGAHDDADGFFGSFNEDDDDDEHHQEESRGHGGHYSEDDNQDEDDHQEESRGHGGQYREDDNQDEEDDQTKHREDNEGQGAHSGPKAVYYPPVYAESKDKYN